MSMYSQSRRHLLRSALAAGGLGLTHPRLAIGQELAPTPACKDDDPPTLPEIEGPFFKPRSPERNDLTIRTLDEAKAASLMETKRVALLTWDGKRLEVTVTGAGAPK